MNVFELCISLGLILTATIALWALQTAKATESTMELVLSFDALSDMVGNAVRDWDADIVNAGGDAREILSELNLQEFAADVAKIAWHYPDAPVADRVTEATRDLLDSLYYPGG